MTGWMIALGAGAAVAAFSALLVAFAGRMENPNARDAAYVRWEQQRKPLVGGLALLMGWLLGAVLLTEARPDVQLSLWLGPVVLAFGLGLADDARGLRPRHKLVGQLACGLCVLAEGAGIAATGLSWLDGVLTVLWVVGLMNSLNMLDNMDGIVALVGAGLLAAGAVAGAAAGADLAWLGAGCLLGYFLLNRHPSRLYLGDSGSQLVGVLLALWGIAYVWNVRPAGAAWPDTLLRVAWVFVVPLADTTLVTVARLLRGQSPAVGGRDHLTHHLRYVGLPVAAVGPVLGLVSFVGGLAAWADWGRWPSLAGLLLLAAGGIALYAWGGRRAAA